MNKFYFYAPKFLLMMVKIREAKVEESVNIVDFQLKMALETESLKLNKEILEHGVLAVFNDAGKGQYYIIESEGKIVGSTLTTYEWSDWRNGTFLWFQSVYILPEFRGNGMFSLFYQYFKEKVEQSDELLGIRLYVDKRNKNAQGVYQKVGMSKEHYEMFEWLNTSV